MIPNLLKSYEYRLYFLVCFTIVGLVSSRAVMSIGVVALFANLLLDFALNPQNLKTAVPNFIQQKKLFSLSFIFFACLVALSYSSQKTIGFNFLLNKLPLLVIPLAFSNLKNFGQAAYQFLLQFFVATLLLSSFVVLYYYFQDSAQANNSIKMGKAIWVPFNHIRYNVMLVFAFITSIYLLSITNKEQIFKRILYFTTALYLFILIHFLSVRSGLLVLYISLLVSLLYYVFSQKKYLLASVALLGMVLLPILSYHYIESFRNKINYSKYDYQQFKANNISGNSDSRRIVSYQVAWQLIKGNMPFGLGTGSLQTEMNSYYSKHFPELKTEDRIAPHNQYMFTLLDYGVLGLLALLATIFYPILALKNRSKNSLYVLFWLCCTIPLLIDISLEMQIGITFFALFSSLLLKRISTSEANV